MELERVEFERADIGPNALNMAFYTTDDSPRLARSVGAKAAEDSAKATRKIATLTQASRDLYELERGRAARGTGTVCCRVALAPAVYQRRPLLHGRLLLSAT